VTPCAKLCIDRPTLLTDSHEIAILQKDGFILPSGLVDCQRKKELLFLLEDTSMSDVYKYIGDRIRDLRERHGEKGISQDELAGELRTAANTISRWETATYKPSIKDLDKLARFFGVSISAFFPEAENPPVRALLSATRELRQKDVQDVIEYARFRIARSKIERAKRRKR